MPRQERRTSHIFPIPGRAGARAAPPDEVFSLRDGAVSVPPLSSPSKTPRALGFSRGVFGFVFPWLEQIHGPEHLEFPAGSYFGLKMTPPLTQGVNFLHLEIKIPSFSPPFPHSQLTSAGRWRGLPCPQLPDFGTGDAVVPQASPLFPLGSHLERRNGGQDAEFLGISFPGVLLQLCPCKGIFWEAGAASGRVQGARGRFSSKSLERVRDARSGLILKPSILRFGGVFS